MNKLYSIRDRTKRLWESIFLDIIFPKRCVDCGKAGDFVCYDCATKIEIIKTLTCPVCGKISKFGQICPRCRVRQGLVLEGLFCSAHYDVGPTKEMIHHFKYSGFTEIGIFLAEMIYQSLRHNLPNGPIVIVPVPLHKNREGKRGFNQSELIARELSKMLDIPGGCAIIRTKDTISQVNLDKKLRINNLVGAFACDDPSFIEGKNVLLVDDVATTLTTLNECAKVLKEAGAKKVWGVVVARRI